MSNESTRISVGRRLPGWTRPMAEGGQFTFDAGGARLFLGYDRPTPEETAHFHHSPIRIGLARADPHTAFFLFDIEGCTAGWADAPYALGVVPPGYRRMPSRRPNEGRLIILCLNDALSGMVHAIRIISTSAAFASVLDTLVAEQRAALASFRPEKHDAVIARAYASWRLPVDIAGNALITESIGAKIGSARDTRRRQAANEMLSQD